MYGWDGGMGGSVGWIAMAVLMVLFWAGVVTIIVVVVRRPHSNQGTPDLSPSHHKAERILNERFARGEIDETEYIARHDALRRPE